RSTAAAQLHRTAAVVQHNFLFAALGADGDRLILLVQIDLVSRGGLYDDALVIVLVLQADGVAAGSDNHPHRSLGFAGQIDSVPQEADDVGMVDVTLLEGNQHLIVLLRHEKSAALL